ncbi:sodium:solute symporter family protein [Pseudozobellia thermophila]|uniref:Solute:Na+ symporter, SSS family n=1 Tax=Pseudozobellia thermophila TaxID=192903 RepID=A0A1M6NXR5_9FLAO|nr:sodium:solute symporter family protein [Pseudozobellia thermophila]SHK00483.1 solute:Na+ symporter, SSS family [Pseudozobellia thermophila]
MLTKFIVAALVYLAILVFLVRRTRIKEKTTSNYLLGGGNIGFVIGLFTTAATLFSAFTVVGMPDFFRTHGIGAWIFLAVSDTMMVYALIRVGEVLRRKARNLDFKGMSGLMVATYQSKLAGYVAFGGAVIFLIPYIAVQISGISLFLKAAFPDAIPVWAWSLIIVAVMVIYSETGGLRAIMYNDTLQGVLLFFTIWIVGYNCIEHFGSIESMFDKVASVNEKLLSVPGPKGLFTPQFFIVSAIAIICLPFTQPQISTRVVIMKSSASLRKMAIGLGVVAILVILPTLFMGMYGAVLYPDASTQDFIGHVLLYDQASGIAALGLIGLVAAAISTSDSQIFALGSELRSLLSLEDHKAVGLTRIFIVVFGLLALVFSIVSTEHLVLLARTSFTGTAMMAPMILVGILSSKKLSLLMPIATLCALAFFILSKLGVGPGQIGILQTEIVLFLALGVAAFLELVVFRSSRKIR